MNTSPLHSVPSPASNRPATRRLSPQLWNLRIPVEIRCPTRPERLPYVTSIPRFSYLAQLLPRLNLYFSVPCTSFRFEGIDLRCLFAGLLSDLYRPVLPWRLDVVDTGMWDVRDIFLNSVKEADFVRNGHARLIMSMGVEDTTGLWQAIIDSMYDGPGGLSYLSCFSVAVSRNQSRLITACGIRQLRGTRSHQQ